ncbi:uncharacterized protein [Littorina saxatilis]|uniref:uncharacterized protein n=1 Tax=Littorina saxatilis TaxID=31220 RepID=UPI0038B538BC
MEKQIFVNLCVFLSISGLAGAVSITDCESTRRYVPGGLRHTFDCYFSGYTTSNIKWTVVKDDGTTMNLGTCNPVCNTNTPHSAILQLKDRAYGNYHSSLRYFFRLLIKATGSKFDGNLTCTETFANGNVESASCTQKAVRIRAYQKEIRVHEKYGSSAYCYEQRQPGSTVTWTLVTYSGHNIDLGNCTSSGTCLPLYPNVTLTRRVGRHSSIIGFSNWQRDMGGQLLCSYTKDGVKETENMTLTVFSPATIDNCSVEISQRNWTAILSCEVTRVFYRSGEYTYKLGMTRKVPKGSYTGTSIYIFDDRKSYRDALTAYTDSTNNQTYYRGRLVISWPFSDVFFTYYSYPNVQLEFEYTVYNQHIDGIGIC